MAHDSMFMVDLMLAKKIQIYMFSILKHLNGKKCNAMEHRLLHAADIPCFFVEVAFT